MRLFPKVWLIAMATTLACTYDASQLAAPVVRGTDASVTTEPMDGASSRVSDPSFGIDAPEGAPDVPPGGGTDVASGGKDAGGGGGGGGGTSIGGISGTSGVGGLTSGVAGTIGGGTTNPSSGSAGRLAGSGGTTVGSSDDLLGGTSSSSAGRGGITNSTTDGQGGRTNGATTVASTANAGSTNSGGVTTGGTIATVGTSAAGATSSGGVNAGGTVATAGTSAGGTTTGSSTSSGYNPCPPTGSECVVLPLGDSITAGFGSTSPGGGYRLEIFRQAVADNKNIRFVGALKSGPVTLAGKTFPQNHEGHGGYNIDSSVGGAGIAGDITNRAMTNYTPHIVLLMIGTNDINGNVDPANAPNRLKNLVNSIITASSTTLVVVSSILPLENTADQKVKTYNSGVKSVVDELAGSGKHVVFLDNYAIFTADTSFRTKWMYDSIHPNDTGYDVLGQSWYGAIGPLLR